jgi:endonuclease/exonuclease/phosphatase family metal-dependent hydrolase
MSFILCILAIFLNNIRAFSVLSETDFKILTWNIDCLTRPYDERYTVITKIIHEEDPDIITLQEANLFFFNELKHNYTGYFKSDYCGALTTMSKYPIIQQKCYIGKTLQYRPVLVVDVLVDHIQVRIINVHLDSSSFYKQIRIAQLKYINTKIDYDNIIYMGDFNFSDEMEASVVHPSFVDAWLIFNLGDGGYTWDMHNNAMALKNSFSDDTNSRLDRVYLKGNFNIHNMYMIGKEKIRDDIWPSDHFGLVVEIGVYDAIK